MIDANSKIILGNAPSSNGDHHGCPYKHYDTQHLGQLLTKLHIGNNIKERQQILDLQKKTFFLLALKELYILNQLQPPKN